MRLYDEIAPYPEDYLDGLPIVVEVSDMARAIYQEKELRTYDWRADFPKILSPWPEAFYEYNVPPTLISGGKVVRVEKPKRIAVLTTTHPATPEEVRDALRGVSGMEYDETHALELNLMRGKHVAVAAVWIVGRGHEPSFHWVAPHAAYLYLMDADGAYLPDSMTGYLHPELRDDPKESEHDYAAFLYAPFLAVSLLHCKNVVVMDHAPPEKVARNRVRQGKPPGTVYKTLAVTVPGSKTPVRLGNLGTGITKGRHIVRGHFATYGEHNKLFGRLTGTFYHPMHVRGRNKDRKIVKDYRLVKGEEAA